MLSSDYLETVADDILKIYDQLEESILQDVIRRIVKTDMVTDTAKWQLEQLQNSGMVYQDAMTQISKITGKNDTELKTLFEDAAVENLKYDNKIYKAAGLTAIPLSQSPAMLQMLTAGLTKTSGTLRNLTMTTATAAQTAYINAANLAYMQVSSGAFSRTQAIKNAIKQAAWQGSTVLYPSGHIDKLDVAVRRATLTGVNQTMANVSIANMEDMGTDLVQVTAHSGARPSHAEWQGKIYSLSGPTDKYEDFYTATGYGTGDGLCGWNCRHNFYPFIEGVDEEMYSASDLEKLNEAKYEYNGKKYTEYEVTQMQRGMERGIRQTRRELIAYDTAMKETLFDDLKVGIKSDFDAAAVKLKSQESALNNLLKQAGIRNKTDRLQVAGFGKSLSQKAIAANKKVIKNYAAAHLTSTGNSSKMITGALRFNSKIDADKIFRPKTEKLWPLLSNIEKKAAYQYTSGSGAFNRPLRGYDKSWNNFVGIGKVPLDNEGAGVYISFLKDAINKSLIDDDVWLFRGSDQQSLAGLLGIDKSKIIPSNVSALNKKFSGTKIKDTGFFSTGIAADAGFKDKIAYEILTPNGTKGIYAEPFSSYGGTDTAGTWDGKQASSYISSEAEIILQAGTSFEIQEIKLISGKVTVILKVL